MTLQYDGTDYVGWQRQPNGASIQELIERALEPIEGRLVPSSAPAEPTRACTRSGRWRACSSSHRSIPPRSPRALNATLPDAVRVASVDEAATDFNARFSATGKVYAYRIWTGPFLPPFERRYFWHVPASLDVDRMREAGRALVGPHDFSAFRAAGSDVDDVGAHAFASFRSSSRPNASR